MKRGAFVCILTSVLASAALGQATTTLTGTLLTYGNRFNTRAQTRTLTLGIKGETSRSEAARLIKVLEDRGQDKLLEEVRRNDLGTLSIDGSIGRRVNAVRIDRVGDKTRVRVVLERWIGFGEFRSGYRSLDYPFTYIELMIDPRTGRGEGTYFGAAKIRMKKNDGGEQIEVEDFGTFPGKILNVRATGRPLP